MRSKNLDLAFGWYHAQGAMISVAGLWKHLDNVVMTQAGTWANFAANTVGLTDPTAFAAACGMMLADWNAGLPVTGGCTDGAAGTQWKYGRPVNPKGIPRYGTEINWQQPFDFLPQPLDNFGLLANATFVQAKQYYFNTNGTVLAYADLTGLSHTSYNATVYYDDQVFQARLSAAFRSKYIPNGGINPGNLNDETINSSTFNLDASSSYKYDDNFTLTFDALNLTDQAQFQYVDSIGARLYYWHTTGREYFVGLRFNY